MPRTKRPEKEATSRLEAHIPTSVYEQMERAASLRGLSLTDYVIAIAREDVRRIVEEAEIPRIARADQIAFAQALIDPPAPKLQTCRREAP